MLNFVEFLNEEKQVGTIYHYTSLQSYFKIIEDDLLRCSEEDGISKYYISFTRNKNFHIKSSLTGISGVTIALVIDGTKLSNKYKIHPIDFFQQSKNLNAVNKINASKRGTSKYPDEDEERIEFKTKTFLTDISKYYNTINIVEKIFDKEVNRIVTFNTKYKTKFITVKKRGGEPFKLNVTNEEKFKKDFLQFLEQNKIKYKFI